MPYRASKITATVARLLTISRLVGLGPFLWLLVEAVQRPGATAKTVLPGLYLFLALSDFLDGYLARLSGKASPRWGALDVGADILFNFSSLAVAASLGLVGPWVPAAVAILGGRYLWTIARRGARPSNPDRADESSAKHRLRKNPTNTLAVFRGFLRRRGAGDRLIGDGSDYSDGFLGPSHAESLPEDRLGKLAGVIYYLLVGWIVLEVSTGGVFGRRALACGGDAVFLYSLAVLARVAMSSRVFRMKRSE